MRPSNPGSVRNRRLVALTALPAAVVLALGSAPAGAADGAGHTKPQGSAKIRFATGFPALKDHEWGFRVGGFGGIRRLAPLRHVPVIMVHGNNVDHADWYPVRDAFKKAGWTDQEMWALSYNGLGANQTILIQGNPERDAEHKEMGWDGSYRVTSNDRNVPDLYDFILAVRAYTGSARFSIAAHSLGVTLARKTLKVHPELRKDLVGFVGIAGANHGTSLCPPGSEGQVESCDEIAAGTGWLDALNGPGGSDETYGPAKWLTVYDGTGEADPAYTGPTYAQSPALKGADNREFPGVSHHDLRLDPAIIAVYRSWLETVEKPYLGSSSPPARPAKVAGGKRSRPLPATGLGTPATAGLGALLAALLLGLAARLRPGDA